MWTRFSKRIALSPRAVNDRWASKNLREQNIARFSSGREHDFYKVTTLGASNGDAKYVQGEIIDQSVDLRAARPGDVIDVPYEVTVNSSLRDFWQSAFYSYDRINTSTPFARSLGLPDQVLPFNLMLFLAGSMSHADQARLQIGFRNAVYHWPGFSGDTFQKRFIIRKLRTTSKKENSVFTIHCQLKNQHDQVVFSCEKTMLYPFKIPPSAEEVPEVEEAQDGAFLDYIVRHAHILQAKGSQTLSPLRPGQLILHTLSRPLTLTHTMQLASLARLTHERHFDTRKYAHEELLVPGGLVLGLTTSLAARDLHEVTSVLTIGLEIAGFLSRCTLKQSNIYVLIWYFLRMSFV